MKKIKARDLREQMIIEPTPGGIDIITLRLSCATELRRDPNFDFPNYVGDWARYLAKKHNEKEKNEKKS